MATPAIEMLIKAYPDVKITIFGTDVSTAIFSTHPNVEKIVIDESKKSRFRGLWLYKKAKMLGSFDRALTFRSSLASRVFLWTLSAKKKARYKKNQKIQRHQVLRYSDFVNETCALNLIPEKLMLTLTPTVYSKPTLGINPGASYGSAKRWYPDKFAEVAIALHGVYDIVIFGGPPEVDMAADIEAILKAKQIKNYQNIAGKTTIVQLCQNIGGLSLFITGDSGPMHVATAYKVPTVALFGPTKDKETSPWQNPKSIIVKKEMACAPCMKRTCPLKHHECMKFIEVDDVLEAVKKLT